MKLETKRIKLTIEDAIFFVRDPGISGFYELLEAQKEGSTTKNIDLFFEHLDEIQGVEIDGEEVKTSKQLRDKNPPAAFIAQLVRALITGLSGEITGADENAIRYSKNG
jgi:hypothetical protein